MAKRITLGSLYKSQNADKSDYIKVSSNLKEPITLKAGDYIQFETKAFQLKSLQAAVAAGRLSEENGEKAKERIEKTPEFVRGELILVIK